jgi:hypothetical protein
MRRLGLSCIPASPREKRRQGTRPRASALSEQPACKNVTVAECWFRTVAEITDAALHSTQSRIARLVIALHNKAPVAACRLPGLSLTRIGVMSFIATLVSLGVIAGTAVTAVVGYGCYSFLRGLFDKPPRPPEGAVFLLDHNPNVRNKLRVNACIAASRSRK